MQHNFDVFSNKFSFDVFKQKYSLDGVENWKDTADRVVENVCGRLITNSDKDKIKQLIYERKFIPGGRYLASAGKKIHFINNCYLFRAEDSSEGWADLMQRATAALMSGGGIGVDYSPLREEGAKVLGKGGVSTGPMALLNMVNESGRFIMQGGQRRSAIYGSLKWKHKDIFKFLISKNHNEVLRDLKKKDLTFPLPLELTNISVDYDTEFFIAIENAEHPLHEHAKKVWELNCLQAFSTAEPGFMFNFRKDNENLRNAPITAGTKVLTRVGYVPVKRIIDQEVDVWTGVQWAKTTFKKTKKNSELVKVDLSNGRSIICDPSHPFIVKNYIGAGSKKKFELVRVAADTLQKNQKIFSNLPLNTTFSRRMLTSLKNYGLGFVFGDGSIRDGRGELSFHVDNKKSAFYAAVDGLNAKIGKNGNRAYFKTELTRKEQLLEENVLSLDFIAGWFDADGCFTKSLLRMSNSNMLYLKKLQESLDFYGIKSVVRRDGKSSYKPENAMFTLAVFKDQLNRFKDIIPTIRLTFDKSYDSYRESEIRVRKVTTLDYKEDVYCCDVKVDEHSFMAEGVIISNCTEVVSEDDSDKCNLGTVWLNRIKDKKELREIVKYSTLLLLCGGVYSDTPTDKIKEVGAKNNRIGLGLGGMHEWLMLKDCGYEVTPELHKWLSIYEQESDSAAFIYSKALNVSPPKGVRAIAPNGTIGIIAETTTGIEPLFCKSYKRRYFKDGKWLHQYVVDGSVKRLLDKGVALDKIQDSYDLSFKQRVKFQADVQNYVDMAISSTCNMPKWGTESNNPTTLAENSKLLLKYAKRLRGFTVYPDGSRDGQPLERVDLQEALQQEGRIFEETENSCVNGICGI